MAEPTDAEGNILVKSNIYPVPDPKFPFLGVHFTRTPDGRITVGPTAWPVLGRENYGGLKGIDLREVAPILGRFASMWLTDPNFRETSWSELQNRFKGHYAKEASKMLSLPGPLRLVRSNKAGIRAQLYDTKGKKGEKLVKDFLIMDGKNSTHVLNANSPAFTSSIPFARHVVGMVLGKEN